ncbi:MAG: Crp/Fnr family transcriptional regulator [Deltaproteobacteria bacterium]|jgi:CRP/FNR family transcriptional regulator|nr:Crp/Fnr family transcriptional regulator [Deltaproteobacteria bacterium]
MEKKPDLAMNKCPCNKAKTNEDSWSPFCVGELWIFNGLKEEELKALSMNLVRASYEPGETIFRQGDQAESIFLIKSGRIRLSRVMENGTEVILDIRKPGDYLGEYILNDLEQNYPYPVTAWCLDKVLTCGFTRKSFEEMVVSYPIIGLTVIRNMAGRIANLTERIEALSQTHLEEKIYAVLLNVAKEHGKRGKEGAYTLELSLTHEDLGFLVGAHRVSVTRIMKRLKEAGRIAQDGKTLVVQGTQSSLQH